MSAPRSTRRAARHRPQILAFQRPAPADPTDPVSITDFVLSQFSNALKRGRDPRHYDQLHVAILNALDESRGVPRVHKGPWRLTTYHMIRWLRAHESKFVAAHPEFFDKAPEDIDEPALLAALERCLPPAGAR